MLFRHDHYAGFARRTHDRFRIDGLECVHIQDTRLEAELLLQNPCRAHRLRHHGPAGEDAQVLAFVGVVLGEARIESVDEFFLLSAQANHIRFAENKRRRFARNDRRGLARETDVLWPHVFEQQMPRGLARLNSVAGYNNIHIRQAEHGEEIFERLVRGAVCAHGDARVRAGHQHVEVGVADGNANLIEVACRGKRGVRTEHGQFAFARQARGSRRG